METHKHGRVNEEKDESIFAHCGQQEAPGTRAEGGMGGVGVVALDAIHPTDPSPVGAPVEPPVAKGKDVVGPPKAPRRLALPKQRSQNRPENTKHVLSTSSRIASRRTEQCLSRRGGWGLVIPADQSVFSMRY